MIQRGYVNIAKAAVDTYFIFLNLISHCPGTCYLRAKKHEGSTRFFFSSSELYIIAVVELLLSLIVGDFQILFVCF